MKILQGFELYFNEPEEYGLRSERLYWLLEAQQPRRFEIVENWMKWAFIQGARHGYQHSLDLCKQFASDMEPIIHVAATKQIQEAERELNEFN